ncbi:MAG: CoB--CoM heterodisulfide reductase iron-sulfur subunit B family protein [Deltaproteobacteria bacterium]|nr:CoB--CoM heterodisulfide reductase iron-sulfur subunit B family protein [Deltaproteobacteria bacterium]
MKTYALYLGCNIPARVQSYESASRAVLERLGVQLLDTREFACCGYPLRNVNRGAFLLSAARNMALAGRMGRDMLVLCSCCFGSLKGAQHQLRRDPEARREVERRLREEGLRYDGDIGIRHLLTVLYHDVGLEALKARISRPFEGLRIGAHYGCHALRPSRITQLDDPVAPGMFDALVEVTGARSIEWDTRMDCCGAPLLGVNDDLSLDLTRSKLKKAAEAGVELLCTACPFCQLQFDTVQRKWIAGNGSGTELVPSLVYPRLLAHSMGMEDERLNLDKSTAGIEAIESP